ncbi:MAG: hypothetical protein WCY75_08425 [Sulfurimonadaceae bacterium]|jgi:hypothetical protein|nr:hypothetical protein [Arcobacteraceae bacterium]
MSNQKSLEKYLIGEVGYLKSDISNGKVIMFLINNFIENGILINE